MNTILQITKVDPELLKEIKPSFNNLPETDHADGKYRLRKYSRVHAVASSGELVHLEDNTFTQSEEYNKHQGGMSRKFENIDNEVIDSKALSSLTKAFFEGCKIYKGQYEFDIHQMRVICKGGATQLSPEGWHQDGYDYIGVVGVTRNNIIGGEMLLSTSKMDTPFLQATIDTGTLVIVNDGYLWHNGRSIQPVDDSLSAWMDVMVFTFKINND
tara:strand:+ start:89 stop:730 length:642 start_codon:yes stop_codon:yes gene_type:complete